MSFRLIALPFLMGLLSAQLSLADAGGSGARGGGSIVRIQGRWELFEIAELRGVAGQQYRPGPETRELLGRIRRLFESYTGIRSDQYWQEVYGPKADYRLVRQLPCAHRRALNFETYGCTIQGVTYFQERAFREKLSPFQQVIAMLHERAHVLDDYSEDAHEKWIHDLIQGIYVLIQIKAEQDSGRRRELSAYELRALDRLLDREHFMRQALTPKTKYESSDVVFSHVFGGGVVRLPSWSRIEQFKAERFFLSIDSELGLSRCGIHDEQSDARSMQFRYRDASVSGSLVECAELESTRISDSSLQFRVHGQPRERRENRLAQLNGGSVRDSTLQLRGSRIELRDAVISDSFIVHDRSDVRITFSAPQMSRSRIEYTSAYDDFYDYQGGRELSEPAVLQVFEVIEQNMKVSSTGRRRVPEGRVLSERRAEVTIDESDCRCQRR